MAFNSDIIIVGSHAPGFFMRIDRIPRAGETVIGWDFNEQMDGGKGSNQAIAAAKLGGKVSFVGCVGQDRIGFEGKRWLDEAGVNTEFLFQSRKVPSGVGFILLDGDGTPAMVTSMGANAEVTKVDIDTALESNPNSKIVLTQFGIPVSIAMYAMEKARRQGKYTILNPGSVSDEPIEDLEVVSILIPNEIESQGILGREPREEFDPIELIKSLKLNTRVETIIITLGGAGMIGIDAEGIWQAGANHVDVVDTSGAGDVFCAAVAVAIANGKEIRQASVWANKAAAISVTKPGTIPAFPTKDEVESFIN